MGWLQVETGHEIALRDGAIIARNAKGKELASVPPKVKKTEEFDKLQQLLTYLRTHDEESGTTVENWMQRGLPVPRAVIASVWPDSAWRSWLKDLVISDEKETLGFLRDASDSGLGVVTVDGESITVDAETVYFPHPALIDDLDDLRELSAELGMNQRLEQLFREVFRQPEQAYEADVKQLSDWADAEFEQMRHATGVAKRVGARVRGDFAVITSFEAGKPVHANFLIGSGDPESPTWTGDLFWSDENDEQMPVVDVPPVAYSEGVRLARLIYAARVVEESK